MINNIIDNNDNCEILGIVKELLCVVISDIENMNDLIIENDILDLGNNKKISKDNFESIVSIIDTISEVL